RGVDLRSGLRVGSLVDLDGEQIAVVLGNDRDGALLDLRVVDLAGADVELGGDPDSLLLQGQGVDLGEHLVLREVSGADHDGPGAAGAAAQRVARATGRGRAGAGRAGGRSRGGRC